MAGRRQFWDEKGGFRSFVGVTVVQVVSIDEVGGVIRFFPGALQFRGQVVNDHPRQSGGVDLAWKSQFHFARFAEAVTQLLQRRGVAANSNRIRRQSQLETRRKRGDRAANRVGGGANIL